MTARCPECGREGDYFSGLAGMRVKCASCPARVQLPSAGADEPFAERTPVRPPPVPLTPVPPSADKQPAPRLQRIPHDWSWLTPWLKRVTVAVAGIGVSGLVARLVAGSDFWIGASILAALLVVGAVIMTLASLFSRRVPHAVEFRVLLVFLVAVCVWWGVGYSFAERTVYTDNYTDQDLTVSVDGQVRGVFPRGTSTNWSLPVGRHVIVVSGTDHQKVDEVAVSVARNGVYVLNLGRAQVYHRGATTYMSSPTEHGSPVATGETNDAWIDAKVDYLFQLPPPSIRVNRRTLSAVSERRTFLYRGRVLGREEAGQPLKVR